MRVLDFDTVDSTNETAKRLIRSGELRQPCYLLAREQTAGRGRRGRRWASPRDAGIYLTVVEFPQPSRRLFRVTPLVKGQPAQTHDQSRSVAAPTTAFTLASAVACAEAIRETASVDVRLKPLNDLYVDGRKLGGILTETIVKDGAVEALITGVGINVHIADRSSPGDAAVPICLEEVLSRKLFQGLDLNALVATDTNALYNTSMGSDPRGGITQSGV